MLSCLSLLLAVTTLVQDSVAPRPAPAPRKARRTPAVTVTPLTPTIEPFSFAPMAIQTMPAIAAMPTIAPMAIAIPDLQAATAALAMQAPNIEMALTAIAPIVTFPDALDDESWEDLDVQEPADSLYQAGRRALNSNRYTEAATTFGRVVSRYPRSARAPEAMYWQAFAMYRIGDTKNLQAAVGVLDRLRRTYPNASSRDAANLAARIDGVLAQQGDEAAARRNQARADSAGRASKVETTTTTVTPRPDAKATVMTNRE
jgi:hypothetical protein